jgi:hypothetical protein
LERVALHCLAATEYRGCLVVIGILHQVSHKRMEKRHGGTLTSQIELL